MHEMRFADVAFLHQSRTARAATGAPSRARPVTRQKPWWWNSIGPRVTQRSIGVARPSAFQRFANDELEFRSSSPRSNLNK